MDPNTYFKTFDGREIDGWSASGGQCTDNVRKFAELCQSVAPNTFEAIAPANAVDFLRAMNRAYYAIVFNTPTNAPGEGDIVVAQHVSGVPGEPPGGYGHVMIARKGCTPHTLLTFDQNWSVRRRCTFEEHPYSAQNWRVLGWGHRR